MASSATGTAGDGRQERPGKARRRTQRRLSGFGCVFSASRWMAVWVAVGVALWGLSEFRRQMALLLPWTVEAFVAAALFFVAFFLSWGWGTLGAMLGWATGRRHGWPEAGAWGGVVGLWLGCGLWSVLGSGIGGEGSTPPLQTLAVALLALALPPLLAWTGARWGPPAWVRLITPLLQRQQGFSRWFAERLLLRRPFHLDLRGVAVGTAAGLIAMGLTVAGAFEYPEAVSLASRIRLRNEAVTTPDGSLEWSRWLSLQMRGLSPARRQPIVLVDLDDATIARMAAATSEPRVQRQVIDRLEAWRAGRVVLPISRTAPVRTEGPMQAWLTRRPPLDDAAYRRAAADLPALAEALRRCDCVLLCVLPDNPLPVPGRRFAPPGTRHARWGDRRRPARGPAPAARTAENLHRPESAAPPPPPPGAPPPIVPAPEFHRLMRGARAVGSAEFDLFYVRQLPLLRPADRERRPSVPSLLVKNEKQRPVSPLIINVFGSAPGALFTHVSYASVLEGRPIYDRSLARWVPPSEFFRDRIVFLDTLRQPMLDTPVGQFTATELLAMATDNLLTGSVLVPPDRIQQFPLMLLMGALVGSLAIRRSPLRAALRLATVVGIYAVAAVGLFVIPGLWIPIVPVVCAAVLAYLLVAQFVFSADQNERERERAERMRFDQELTISHEIQTSLLPVGRRVAPLALGARRSALGSARGTALPAGKAASDVLYGAPSAERRALPSGDFADQYGRFVVVGRSEPAREVGGDFYDVFPLDDDRLALVLGDVSGKGVPGALFMAVTTTLLQAYARLLPSPEEVLARANEELYPKMRGALGPRRRRAAMFVTAFYGILETSTGRLRYASAGQVPPILAGPDWQASAPPLAGGAPAHSPRLRSAPAPYRGPTDRLAREARYLPGRGTPLGALRDAAYECHEVCLAPGDLLALASDGFVEATTRVGRPPGEALGYDRFLKLVARHAHLEPTACAAAIFADLHRQLTADRERDDLTLVVVRHQP